jgi:tetratricopeptide (TPR) repeat protein
VVAITYLDKALAIDPNNKHALNTKGQVLNDLGNDTQDIPLFDKAIAIDHNYKHALEGRAQAIAAIMEKHR